MYFLTNFKAYNAALMDGTSRDETGDTLAYAMKLIIIPLLSRSFELRQHEVVGQAAVETMVKDMFDPIEDVQGMDSVTVRHTRLVLLPDLPLLLKYLASCLILASTGCPQSMCLLN